MYKLIVFDLDGTLVDSVPDLADAVNYALLQEQLPQKTEVEIRQAVGNGLKKLLARTAVTTNEILLEKLSAHFQNYYNRNCCKRSKLYEGINKLVQTLMQHDIKLAVYTNKPEEFVKPILENYFPLGTFANIIGQTKGAPLKPDPSRLLAYLKSIDVTPQECCFVGDSDVDVMTAQNAEMPMIAVLWGYHDVERLFDAGAVNFAHHANELEKMLLQG